MAFVAENPLGVSLVIVVYNGADRIEKTLQYIQKQQVQSHFPWEVVVVDDASTDNTIHVLENTWHSEIPLKITKAFHRGTAHARIKGIEEASFEFISFIDDDNHIADNWVETVYQTFCCNSNISMCGGENAAVFESSPPSWFHAVEHCYAIGKQGGKTEDITVSKGFLWGAGLSFRKSVFQKLQKAGFSVKLNGRTGKNMMAGEDTELCLAFIAGGYRIWYIETLRLDHYMPAGRITWDNAKKLFIGLGNAEYILDLYRMVIRKQPFPFLKIYFSLICFIPVYFGWRLVMLPTNQQNNPRYLSYLARKSYIIFAIFNVRNYFRWMDDIRHFYQKVNKP